MTSVTLKCQNIISVILNVLVRVNYKEMMANGKIAFEWSDAYDCTQIKKSLQT
jgi:hypothetical protein